jgi:hypothetical protein
MFAGLISELQHEAADEAESYNTFACHCKSSTAEKSAAIDTESTAVDTRVAELEGYTASEKATEKRIRELTEEIASLEADIAHERSKWSEYVAKYTAEHTDMVAACESLHTAIADVTQGISFLQVKEKLSPVLVLADAYGLTTSASKGAVMFLQGEGDVPEQDYENHSGGIVETLNRLEQNFLNEKAEMEAEHDKRTSAHNEYMSGLNAQLATSEASKTSSKENLAQIATNVGLTSKDLTEQQSMLYDDQLYLKDLTESCEAKAKEWDQRTAARAGELEMLEEARTALGGAVAAEGSRALVQTRPFVAPSRAVSFVQVEEHVDERLRLKGNRLSASEMLRAAGKKLGSTELVSLSDQVRVDPFAKIKGLIQGLITRLLKEAAAEATQKGFCDTEVGKARLSRDTEVDNVAEVSAAIKANEADRAKLTAKVDRLSSELAELSQDLELSTSQRSTDKHDNEEAIKSAEEGKKAVSLAMKIMKDHYAKMKTKGAVHNGGNAVLLQGPGAYTGSGGGGIMDMLEVIKTDFERAMKQTADQESKAHEEFLVFSREAKQSIAAKETSKHNCEQDLAEATSDLIQNIESLRQHQELVDVALQQLDKLRPACIDTGMTHEERKARREAEITALQNALKLFEH